MGQRFLLFARCGSDVPLIQLLIDSDEFFVKYFEVCDYEDAVIAKQVAQLVEDLRPDTQVQVLSEVLSLSIWFKVKLLIKMNLSKLPPVAKAGALYLLRSLKTEKTQSKLSEFHSFKYVT